MKHLFTTLIFSLSIGVCVAQTDTTAAPAPPADTTLTAPPADTARVLQTLPAATTVATPAVTEVFRKNIVKMNLSSLAFSNYSFSYERSVSRKITLSGGYSFTPETKLSAIPLFKKGLELAEVSEEEGEAADEVEAILNEADVKSNALTGEVRFYTGKKPGARGFYASLYGRYTTMSMSHMYVYEDDLGFEYDLPINAKVNGFGGGVMLGAQWLIAKRVTFDWYIVGGHYGKLSGDFTAKTDLTMMPEDDRAALEEDIEDIFTIGDKKYVEADVNDNGMFGKMNGPFAGIRGLGFNIGIAF